MELVGYTVTKRKQYGPIYSLVSSHMEDTAKFSPLNEELSNWVKSQLELLEKYFEVFGISCKRQISAESMDDLWNAWKSTEIKDSEAIDSFLNCFGIGFGQLLINKLGFDWTYLEDEYGADIAVRALPGTANLRIAPLHFVSKRWNSNDREFIKEAIEEIDIMLDKYAREHGITR